jgi:hypothetical protein
MGYRVELAPGISAGVELAGYRVELAGNPSSWH